MITLGLIVFLLGLLFSIWPMWLVGLVVIAGGVGLYLVGRSGRTVAGRQYWY